MIAFHDSLSVIHAGQVKKKVIFTEKDDLSVLCGRMAGWYKDKWGNVNVMRRNAVKEESEYWIDVGSRDKEFAMLL